MKTYAKDVTLRLKMISTRGKLIGVHQPAPKETKTQLVHPETHEDMKQFYVAPSFITGDEISTNELRKKDDCPSAFVHVDKASGKRDVKIVDKEALKETKKSILDKNVAELTVHDALVADQAMFQSKEEQSYVFYPHIEDKKNVLDYTILKHLVSDPSLAFCCLMNLQNHECLIRLTLWRDRIVLVKQNFPESINPHEPPAEGDEPEIPTEFFNKLANKIKSNVSPLEPDTYRDAATHAKKGLHDGEPPATVTEIEPSIDSHFDDLLEMFD